MKQLSEQELYCITGHMVAMHRQSVFEETANLAEPCEKCRYVKRCCENHLFVWHEATEKLSKQTNIEFSFAIGVNPLLPKEK